MFKKRISIYMKSGNVIYVRSKKYEFTKLTDNNAKCLSITKNNLRNWAIDLNQVEAIIVKSLYQNWG